VAAHAGKTPKLEAGTAFAMPSGRNHPVTNLKEIDMAEESRELVMVLTHGIDHELSSVGFTIANGGITAGLKVAVFLTSAAVDVVRKKASDTTHVKPLDPLARHTRSR
jgi:hypothetical protein